MFKSLCAPGFLSAEAPGESHPRATRSNMPEKKSNGSLVVVAVAAGRFKRVAQVALHPLSRGYATSLAKICT